MNNRKDITNKENIAIKKHSWIDDMRLDPNNISYWYPRIKECGMNVPKTVIIQLPDEVFIACFHDKPDDEEKIIDFIHFTVMPEIEGKIKVPFIKNGTFSNKFDFRTCTPYPDAYSIALAFGQLNYASLFMETGGSTEIAIRERIPYNETLIPTIYHGMPLRPEFRIFYDFDERKVLGCFNYWDFNYCFKAISRNATDRIVYREYYPHIESLYSEKKDQVMEMVSVAMKDVDMKGKWSIDVMYDETKETFWLIDMAQAHRSAYWELFNKEEQL